MPTEIPCIEIRVSIKTSFLRRLVGSTMMNMGKWVSFIGWRVHGKGQALYKKGMEVYARIRLT